MTGGIFLLRVFTVLCWVGNQQKARKRKTPQVVLFAGMQAARRGGGCQGELFSSLGWQASAEMVQRSATLMWAPCLLLRNTEWKQNDKKRVYFSNWHPQYPMAHEQSHWLHRGWLQKQALLTENERGAGLAQMTSLFGQLSSKRLGASQGTGLSVPEPCGLHWS